MTYPKAVIGDSKYKNKNGETTHEKINIEMLRQVQQVQFNEKSTSPMKVTLLLFWVKRYVQQSKYLRHAQRLNNVVYPGSHLEAYIESMMCVWPEIFRPPSTRLTTPTPSWKDPSCSVFLYVDTWQDVDTDQTELDAVEDPLDGEACQEDHTGEEHQADVEAACLDPCLTHATHPHPGCLVSDVTREWCSGAPQLSHLPPGLRALNLR